MPSITFIPNPTIGQEYTAENGQVYTWTGSKWQSNATLSPTVANLPVTDSIIPEVDNAVDLGSPTNRFRHLYVAPGTIYLGDIKLTNLNGKLAAKKVVNPGEENEEEDNEDSDAFSEVRGGGGGSADRLVNGDLELVYNENGYLTFPGSWGGSTLHVDQETAEFTISTPGNIVLNNTSGTWTFNTNGDIILPAEGDIKDSNGNSVLGGGGGGNANTGNIQFEDTTLTSPNGNGPWYNGVITLAPGAQGSNDYGNNGQFINIYPTWDFDAPHIHIAAGTGENGTGDLILGPDGHHIDINHDGKVYVKTNNQTKTWAFDDTGAITFPDGTVQTTAYVTAEEKGFFTEFTHPADNNRVDMQAVAVGPDGCSYVSYSYYNDNDSRRYGGITKLNPAGLVVWTKDIASPNNDAEYVKIPSLEFVTIPEAGSYLTAYGYFWDNSAERDVGFNYFLDPLTGNIDSMFSLEINANYSVELKDGVFGSENGGPVAVVAGEAYSQNLQKSFTILSPSTVDRVYISWADYEASGLNAGDQVYYYVNGYYGMIVNKFDVVGLAPGAGNPWDGIYLQVSVTKNGSDYSYNIMSTNGWSGALGGWSVPQNITILGSKLGGIDGVNDLTFDFDTSVFNYNSSNLQAAISNIQGTPFSDAVVCPAWNGKDWSTEIGNTLTFEYQLNRQAVLAKIGGIGNWTKELGVGEYETFESVTVDSSGNVYAVGYYWTGSKGSLVAKYDSTGVKQWAVHIDPAGNTGNTVFSVDLLPDGNLITVADGDGIVTKINSSDGSIMWQIMNDGDPSWDSDFRGTATPDGNYILANYEDNDYTMYVICVNGTDGSILWTKQISRAWAGDNGEIYPQNDYDAQYIDCNDTHVVIAGTSEVYYNDNNHQAGVVISLPLDGEGVDGTYGQYVIQSASLNWETQSTTATPAVIVDQGGSISGSIVTPTTTEPSFAVDKTSIGGGEATTVVAGIERHSASTGNNNITLAEEHNGKFLYYKGSDGNAWIYCPSNSDAALPIGFTVTVVMDDFNGNRIYVNNNTGNQAATVNASGFDYNQTNYWKFGQDGKNGIYTIMKVDTDRWMLAGPDITTD